MISEINKIENCEDTKELECTLGSPAPFAANGD